MKQFYTTAVLFAAVCSLWVLQTMPHPHTTQAASHSKGSFSDLGRSSVR